MPPVLLPQVPPSAAITQSTLSTNTHGLGAVSVQPQTRPINEPDVETDEVLVQCLRCKTVFTNVINLNNHLRNSPCVTKGDRRCSQCQQCYVGLNADLYCETHLLLEHKKKTYICNICGFRSHEHVKIVEHFVADHNDLGPTTLWKILIYTERPLCEDLIKSSIQLISGSSKVLINKEQHLPRTTEIVQPDESLSVAANTLQKPSKFEEIAPMDLTTPPSHHSSRTSTALTPASLVSLVAGKLSNSIQDHQPKQHRKCTLEKERSNSGLPNLNRSTFNPVELTRLSPVDSSIHNFESFSSRRPLHLSGPTVQTIVEHNFSKSNSTIGSEIGKEQSDSTIRIHSKSCKGDAGDNSREDTASSIERSRHLNRRNILRDQNTFPRRTDLTIRGHIVEPSSCSDDHRTRCISNSRPSVINTHPYFKRNIHISNCPLEQHFIDNSKGHTHSTKSFGVAKSVLPSPCVTIATIQTESLSPVSIHSNTIEQTQGAQQPISSHLSSDRKIAQSGNTNYVDINMKSSLINHAQDVDKSYSQVSDITLKNVQKDFQLLPSNLFRRTEKLNVTGSDVLPATLNTTYLQGSLKCKLIKSNTQSDQTPSQDIVVQTSNPSSSEVRTSVIIHQSSNLPQSNKINLDISDHNSTHTPVTSNCYDAYRNSDVSTDSSSANQHERYNAPPPSHAFQPRCATLANSGSSSHSTTSSTDGQTDLLLMGSSNVTSAMNRGAERPSLVSRGRTNPLQTKGKHTGPWLHSNADASCRSTLHSVPESPKGFAQLLEKATCLVSEMDPHKLTMTITLKRKRDNLDEFVDSNTRKKKLSSQLEWKSRTSNYAVVKTRVLDDHSQDAIGFTATDNEGLRSHGGEGDEALQTEELAHNRGDETTKIRANGDNSDMHRGGSGRGGETEEEVKMRADRREYRISCGGGGENEEVVKIRGNRREYRISCGGGGETEEEVKMRADRREYRISCGGGGENEKVVKIRGNKRESRISCGGGGEIEEVVKIQANRRESRISCGGGGENNEVVKIQANRHESDMCGEGDENNRNHSSIEVRNHGPGVEQHDESASSCAVEHSCKERGRSLDNSTVSSIENESEEVDSEVNSAEKDSGYGKGDTASKNTSSSQIELKNLVFVRESRMFRNQKISHEYSCRQSEYRQPAEFLTKNKNELLHQIRALLTKKGVSRVQISVNYALIKHNTDEPIDIRNRTVSTVFYNVTRNSIESTFAALFNEIKTNFNVDNITECGWATCDIKRIYLVFIYISRTFKSWMGSYVAYPENVPGQRKVLNINSGKEEDCLELHLIASLLKEQDQPVENLTRPGVYRKNKDKINIPPNVSYPASMQDLQEYEELNSLAVNIYRLSKMRGTQGWGQLTIAHLSNKFHEEGVRIVSLLQLGRNHVCLIKDFDNYMKTISNYASNRLKTPYFCRACFGGFSTEEEKEQHENKCSKDLKEQKILYPERGEVRKFTKYNALTSPYFTAAFNSDRLHVKKNENKGEETAMENDHRMVSYCYIITNRAGEIVKQRTERTNSSKIATEFFDNILQDWEDAKKSLVTYPIPVLTPKEEKDFYEATRCDLCRTKFSAEVKKVRRHDHDVEGVKINGKTVKSNYLACVCRKCNFRTTHKRYDLPVLVHGLDNCDAKLMMKALKDNKFIVAVLTKTGEKYYSIRVSKKQGKGNGIKLIDSCNFMEKNLSDLCNDLVNSGEEMKITKEALTKYPDAVTTICLQKRVYCYEYIDSFERFNETCLPPKTAFFSSAKNESISEEDYQHAKKVWDAGKCSTLGDFHDLHLTSATAILAEVFTSFRTNLKRDHRLDPINYYNLPSYAFDAALFKSKTELELLHCPQMVGLMERSIRRGFSTVSANEFRANNKYMENYNPKEETKYIIHIAYNNLCSSQMMGFLPHSKFRKLSQSEINEFDLTQKQAGTTGYFVECDLIISSGAAVSTDELPLGADQIDVVKHLSNHDKKQVAGTQEEFITSEKLAANQLMKESYITTLPLLQLFMDLGIQVTEVKNIISFKQKPFFKSFFERNSNLMKKTISSFESKTLEMLSTSAFDLTIFNKRVNNEKHRVVKTQHFFEKYCADPFLKNVIDISETTDYSVFVSVSEEIVLDQPIHIGFQILENSKLKMYHLFHKVIKHNYGDKVKLLYSDRNSFILGFTGVDDIYEDMSSGALAPHMDLSNFEPGTPFFDDSKRDEFGYVKNVMGGAIITEAICLLPKSFSLLTERPSTGTRQTMAAKGASHRGQQNNRHEAYRKLLAGARDQL